MSSQKVRTRRNPLVCRDDYVIERAELEFVPHHVPARFFLVSGEFVGKAGPPTEGRAEQLPLVGSSVGDKADVQAQATDLPPIESPIL